MRSEIKNVKDLSAFNLSLWSPFGVDYYKFSAIDVVKLLKSLYRIYPKFYQVLDVYSLYYFDKEKVVSNLKKEVKTFWQKLIDAYVRSREYIRINEITRGNHDLSVIASVQFFKKLIEYVTREMKMKPYVLNQQVNVPDEKFNEVVKCISCEVTKQVQEYLEGSSVLQYLPSVCEGGQSYALDALSVMTFLSRPDEWRRRVMLIRGLIESFKILSSSLPISYTRASVVSERGVVMGTSVLQRFSQLRNIRPIELMYPEAIKTLRIISKKVTVREYGTTITPVVYIDKSGSMREELFTESPIPKISGACGLGLALYKKFNAKIYFFDTEVHEVNPREIIKVLLTVEATGGTNIENVLKHISQNSRNNLYIIITDGISRVDEDFAKEVASTHRVVFCLLPPCEKRRWLKYFKVVEVKKVTDLVKALQQ